jgi:HEAT repeat protein
MKPLLAALAVLLALTAADPDKVRAAKALYFDRKYAEARQAWQEVLGASTGGEAEAAAYWVARSSESLGEHERAFREFGSFLARKPADRELLQEARTHQLGLAARLYREGKVDHLALLHQALHDPSANVRDFAALQLGGLGSEAGRPAVPVLKQIVAASDDEDLVQRAKLALLRLDPASLADIPSRPDDPPMAGGAGRVLEVRIYSAGKRRPEVRVRLPMALAEVLFKSLPDEARRELRKKGYDADNFWKELQRLGKGRVVDIEGDDGERVQITIE